MKFSKKTLLIITSGILSISALGLMFVSADRLLFMDSHNAVQHIESVKIISTESNNNTTATLENANGSVGIETNNLILGQSGNNKNTIENNVTSSSILGGESNTIKASSKYSVILGGSGNQLSSESNTIIGGEINKINGGKYQTIAGGRDNTIDGGQTSVIVGGHDNYLSGNNSVVMGNNSSVTGDYSVALGSGSKVQANNSFLWTDGNSSETLQTNDVFAVMAENGVVINSSKAHNFAKLTIGGPLILSQNANQSNIMCGQGKGGGTIKVQASVEGQLCICSCDGSGWSYMGNHGTCENVCNESLPEPKCGTKVTHICDNDGIMYSGSCEIGKVVEGTGAYFIDKKGIIHRSCQTDYGKVKSCTGKNENMEEEAECLEHLSQCRFGASRDKNGNECQTTIQCNNNQISTNDGRCQTLGSCLNYNFGENAGKNNELQGFSKTFKLNWYRPIMEDKIWECVDREITDEDAHQCRFSCDNNHECVFVGTGTWQSSQNAYRTCKPKQNRCAGDYTMGNDGSMDSYGILTGDSVRLGKVYKNPNPEGDKSQNFIFLSSIDEINENAYGCYVVCNPGNHEPCNGNLNGHCSPNCEYQYSSEGAQFTKSTGGRNNDVDCKNEDGTKKGDGNKDRRHRKYKTRSEHNEFINEHTGIDLGIGESNSCIRSCQDGYIPIVIYGTSRDNNNKIIKHAYLVSGEFKSNEPLTEFDKFLEQKYVREANNDASDNLVCWHQCSSSQYFNGRRCANIINGFVLDTGDVNNRITYSGITNYGIRKACNNSEIRDYNQGKCVQKEIKLKEDCEKIPWQKRVGNSCKACTTTGQFLTEIGECDRCSNNDIPETSCTCGTGELRLRSENKCLQKNEWLLKKDEECKNSHQSWYKRIDSTGCIACNTTGQYMTSTGTCRSCKDDNITDDNRCTCNDGEIRIHQINECVPNSLTGEAKCNKIIEKKPWYKRISSTNKCEVCETGQYVKDDGSCAPCDDTIGNKCTPQST